ncbi:hypothetical protein [Burkholderia gladioli]|uniref:hypothetical protein n=1 Tax=Burkholderia gladioli TaxID=28095 RepID=UPI001641660D|nr:hypothetical protein [Burkholderia gladioli]
MKRTWEITQLAFVWLLIAIGFLSVFRIWTIVARVTGSPKDFWDVAAAIGTCGAVIVALYIASADKRQKRHAELSSARVSASGMYARIGVAIGAVQVIQLNVAGALTVDQGPAVLMKIGSEFSKMPKFESSELRDLIPLGNFCAENISAAVDRVQIAQNFVQMESAKLNPTRADRDECLHFVNAILLEAIRMLQRGSKTIEATSAVFRDNFKLTITD